MCAAVLTVAGGAATRPTTDPGPSAERGYTVAQRFQLPVSSGPQYAVLPPSVDPESRVTRLRTDDGVELYVETWLSAAEDGRVPPDRVPRVMLVTPYHAEEQEAVPLRTSRATRHAGVRIHAGSRPGDRDVYNPDQMEQEGDGTRDACDDPPGLVCIYYEWPRTVWPCW